MAPGTAPRIYPSALHHTRIYPKTIGMKPLRLALLLIPALLFCSCSTTVDEYNYGYAPAYRTLPENFKQATIDGETYWHHGGRFYKDEGAQGFLLVKPPRGSEAIVAAAAGGTPNPTGDPVATPAKRESWITPGGAAERSYGPAKNFGRSAIRRRRPSLD